MISCDLKSCVKFIDKWCLISIVNVFIKGIIPEGRVPVGISVCPLPPWTAICHRVAHADPGPRAASERPASGFGYKLPVLPYL